MPGLKKGALVVVKDPDLTPFDELQTGEIIKTLVEKRKFAVSKVSIILKKYTTKRPVNMRRFLRESRRFPRMIQIQSIRTRTEAIMSIAVIYGRS